VICQSGRTWLRARKPRKCDCAISAACSTVRGSFCMEVESELRLRARLCPCPLLSAAWGVVRCGCGCTKAPGDSCSPPTPSETAGSWETPPLPEDGGGWPPRMLRERERMLTEVERCRTVVMASPLPEDGGGWPPRMLRERERMLTEVERCRTVVMASPLPEDGGGWPPRMLTERERMLTEVERCRTVVMASPLPEDGGGWPPRMLRERERMLTEVERCRMVVMAVPGAAIDTLRGFCLAGPPAPCICYGAHQRLSRRCTPPLHAAR
jgi:hypothetical protein